MKQSTLALAVLASLAIQTPAVFAKEKPPAPAPTVTPCCDAESRSLLE